VLGLGSTEYPRGTEGGDGQQGTDDDDYELGRAARGYRLDTVSQTRVSLDGGLEQEDQDGDGDEIEPSPSQEESAPARHELTEAPPAKAYQKPQAGISDHRVVQ